MRDCRCGRPVRLSAIKITINRRRGIAHAIVHREDDSPPCEPGTWATTTLKPYPRRESDCPWRQLLGRWEITPTPDTQGRIDR